MDSKKELLIVYFISFAFTDIETRYYTTERKALAVIKYLREVN